MKHFISFVTCLALFLFLAGCGAKAPIDLNDPVVQEQLEIRGSYVFGVISCDIARNKLSEKNVKTGQEVVGKLISVIEATQPVEIAALKVLADSLPKTSSAYIQLSLQALPTINGTLVDKETTAFRAVSASIHGCAAGFLLEPIAFPDIKAP